MENNELMIFFFLFSITYSSLFSLLFRVLNFVRQYAGVYDTQETVLFQLLCCSFQYSLSTSKHLHVFRCVAISCRVSFSVCAVVLVVDRSTHAQRTDRMVVSVNRYTFISLHVSQCVPFRTGRIHSKLIV